MKPCACRESGLGKSDEALQENNENSRKSKGPTACGEWALREKSTPPTALEMEISVFESVINARSCTWQLEQKAREGLLVSAPLRLAGMPSWVPAPKPFPLSRCYQEAQLGVYLLWDPSP